MSVCAVTLSTSAWFKRSPAVLNAGKGNLQILIKWRNRHPITDQTTNTRSTLLCSLERPMTHRRATAVVDKHNRRCLTEVTIFSIARYASASTSAYILLNQVYARGVNHLASGEAGRFEGCVQTGCCRVHTFNIKAACTSSTNEVF
jgi:hypothetical protein